MSEVSVFGAGAFGTALAISLAREGREVSLVARDQIQERAMIGSGENAARLPGFAFPKSLIATSDADSAAEICLIAVPTQNLSGFLRARAGSLKNRTLVACCKGVDLTTGKGPTDLIADYCPSATPAILSGPSFAIDIAAGLPTALTLATADDAIGAALQSALSTANLRFYRSTDVIGVELGGALKNVIAIAAGVTIGAGLGESARAALMTRGYAEIQRFAVAAGARPDTLSGLSGFGDLTLTCTSDKSRNFGFGLSIGCGRTPVPGSTVEGIATAKAVANLAVIRKIDMPITAAVAALLEQKITVGQAIELLLSRPLKEE